VPTNTVSAGSSWPEMPPIFIGSRR
jgi:hypothetical protein